VTGYFYALFAVPRNVTPSPWRKDPFGKKIWQRREVHYLLMGIRIPIISSLGV
jgi:hypothetical protein